MEALPALQKMKKTESEVLFERKFCEQNSILCRRVDAQATPDKPSPDYELDKPFLNQGDVVHFIMVRTTEDVSSELRVIFNSTEELNRLLPKEN